MNLALAEKSVEVYPWSEREGMEAAYRLVRDERILPRPSALYATGEVMGRMNRVYVKDETENPTGAFKLRGAWVRMSLLSPAERLRGVVTASAGNHAQGVAMAANLLGVHADIYVPADAPECKRLRTRQLGGDMVTLHEVSGTSFDEALLAADAHCAETRATFIHPYDDAQVIIGQGTIGSEIIEQLPGNTLPGLPGVHEDPSKATIFVPVGGGGLAAGVAMAYKSQYPTSRVVGVQLEGADSAARSWGSGHRLTVARPDTLTDGTAVRTVGQLTHGLLQRYIDDFVTVSPAELGHAYVEEFNRRASLAVFGDELAAAGLPETSGMLSRAGAMKFARYDEQGDAPWVLLQTGRNVDWAKVERAVGAYQETKVDVSARVRGCGALRAMVPRN